MARPILTTALFLAAISVVAQEKGFTVRGIVPLPDGYQASIVVHTDTAYSVSIGNDATIKDGQFVITGQMEQPQQGTLMTNNLSLIEQRGWPVDSVRWTYDEIFLSPGELTFTLDNKLTGTPIQTDYNEWLGMGEGASPWQFIDNHPQSVVSVWLANQLLQRGYRLTADEVARLDQTIRDTPADPKRFAQFQKRIAAAKKTVKNAPVTDLELIDTVGNVCHLTDIVGQIVNGKCLLIDFWASWCGICLYSMPEIAELATQYSDRFCVIGISIDTKESAWRKAMEKHPAPWPQYCTTKQGYQDLFDKYQVGNGVPYYLLVSPEGKVISSPEGPAEVREFLEEVKSEEVKSEK